MNPFNAGGQTYQGGSYIAAGLGHFGDAIGGALQKWGDLMQQANTTDAIMSQLNQTPDPTDPTGQKKLIPDNVMKGYLAHSTLTRGAAGAGAMGALDMYNKLRDAYGKTQLEQAQTGAIPSEIDLRQAQARENTAHANYLIGSAGNEAGLGGAPKGKIWSDELGGYATPAQADAALRRSPAGYLKQAYGLTPAQIFDPSQHEGGTVAVDPTTGAKTFTNDPNGDQIRIGGPSGVVMPMAEFNIYKRQLQMGGLGTVNMGDGSPGGAPGAPGGAATGPATTTAVSNGGGMGGGPGVPGGLPGMPAGSPAGAGAATTPGTVRVRSPQGVVGSIPANRLQEAVTAGYTQI